MQQQPSADEQAEKTQTLVRYNHSGRYNPVQRPMFYLWVDTRSQVKIRAKSHFSMLNIKQFTFNLFSENTYLVYDDSHNAVIIDPGCYDSFEQAQLLAYINQKALVPQALWLTHAHIDHVLGNPFVFEQWGLTPQMHRAEISNLERLPAYAPTFGFPPVYSPAANHFFEAGDVVKVGDHSLEILFAPGHSAGSICFYHREGGWLMGGDVLFRESIGRTDLPGGDYATLIQSIRNQLFTLADATIVYSGHGPATTIGYEKQHNPFLK